MAVGTDRSNEALLQELTRTNICGVDNGASGDIDALVIASA